MLFALFLIHFLAGNQQNPFAKKDAASVVPKFNPFTKKPSDPQKRSHSSTDSHEEAAAGIDLTVLLIFMEMPGHDFSFFFVQHPQRRPRSQRSQRSQRNPNNARQPRTQRATRRKKMMPRQESQLVRTPKLWWLRLSCHNPSRKLSPLWRPSASRKRRILPPSPQFPLLSTLPRWIPLNNYFFPLFHCRCFFVSVVVVFPFQFSKEDDH